MRFIAWAMLISTAFVIGQFLAMRPLSALAAPPRIHLLVLAMALLSTVLPTYLIAEAIKRIGADRTSLVGSLGPVFTIALGYWILGEPVFWIQIVGAALVVIVKNVVSAYIERWNMLLGLVFLFIVLVMPTGIVPGFSKLSAALRGEAR